MVWHRGKERTDNIHQADKREENRLGRGPIHQHHHPINRESGPLPSLFSALWCMLSVLSFPLYRTIYCQPDVSMYYTGARCSDVFRRVFTSRCCHVSFTCLLSVPGHCFSFWFCVYSWFFSLSPFPEDVKASVREDSFFYCFNFNHRNSKPLDSPLRLRWNGAM